MAHADYLQRSASGASLLCFRRLPWKHWLVGLPGCGLFATRTPWLLGAVPWKPLLEDRKSRAGPCCGKEAGRDVSTGGAARLAPPPELSQPGRAAQLAAAPPELRSWALSLGMPSADPPLAPHRAGGAHSSPGASSQDATGSGPAAPPPGAGAGRPPAVTCHVNCSSG